MDKIEILATYYPLRDILEQNDIETRTVVEWLVEEGYVDLEDYFYEDMEELS